MSCMSHHLNNLDETPSIHEWVNQPTEQKLVHDAIHDSFFLPSEIWTIIDKPEFQRLRQIAQTGNTRYIYPCAEHSRFSHCIGVAHLCIEFARTIQRDNPDLLTDRDILLLGVAGLIHDIGHCAFSHLYDSLIVPVMDPTSDFCHEQASCQIFLNMYDKYSDLQSCFTPDEKLTICKLILGYPGMPETQSKMSWLQWNEWDDIHRFYYEILSNDRLGIDVDKFDYLKRDSHYTGVHTTFNPSRLINLYYIDRVTDRYGVTRYFLAYQPKANEIIKVMWQSRDDLHRRVYQHRVVKCIDLMTAEAIIKCGDIMVGFGDHELPLRLAHTNMETYCQLTDSSIRYIARQVPEAQDIFNKIDHRQLWKTLASIESEEKQEFKFSNPDLVVSTSHLQNIWIYHVFNKGESEPDSVFYRELITCANGSAITLR